MTPSAVLGDLPFALGSVTLPIPQLGIRSNSQAFWLPAPVDGNLVVTLNANDLPSPTNEGEVEIHGFYPGGAPA